MNKDPIPLEIFNKIHKKKNGNNWTTAFFYLMKELHLSDKELLEMPIPRIRVLLDELHEHAKREKKAMKKK
jgi:hypothetical protein